MCVCLCVCVRVCVDGCVCLCVGVAPSVMCAPAAPPLPGGERRRGAAPGGRAQPRKVRPRLLHAPQPPQAARDEVPRPGAHRAAAVAVVAVAAAFEHVRRRDGTAPVIRAELARRARCADLIRSHRARPGIITARTARTVLVPAAVRQRRGAPAQAPQVRAQVRARPASGVRQDAGVPQPGRGGAGGTRDGPQLRHNGGRPGKTAGWAAGEPCGSLAVWRCSPVLLVCMPRLRPPAAPAPTLVLPALPVAPIVSERAMPRPLLPLQVERRGTFRGGYYDASRSKIQAMKEIKVGGGPGGVRPGRARA